MATGDTLTRTASRCRRCGEASGERARYCSGCGAPLDEQGAGAARKTVTVLRADVIGSTALGEQLDPESLRRLFGRYFDRMRDVLERHGATVEKFIGDAVMGVFGIPRVHEDDALRAVRAALEMRVALAELNDELEPGWGVRLEMRLGLNTGEVVTGGGPHTLVSGDPVNVAARLEQAAAPGEILLGAETARLVRDTIETEPLTPLVLKGKAERVAAHRVLGEPAAAREPKPCAPFVGRTHELALLRQAFERAETERTCHLFTLLGPAGIGKSRLVGEALDELGSAARVLRGRCLSYGEGITLWPLVEVVRQAAALSAGDEPERVRASLESLLDTDEHAAAVASRVAELIGAGEPRDSAEEGFWALRKLLEHLARERPLVLVFDDVHWGEPTFLDLVEHVADWARDAPILLVCIGRADLLDARPGWGGGKLNSTSIGLEPLPEPDCGALIDNLLGDGGLGPERNARIAEIAGGNPLFVEETVSMLVDDGLVLRGGRWHVERDLSNVAVPATIQALLAARLDRLDPEERRVLERASVEGQVFHRGAVRELCGGPVDDALDALVRRGLVRPETAVFAGEDCFRFRHGLLRDAAYSTLAKEERATLHERYAAWLARATRGHLREYEEFLGYHLEQAHRLRAELSPVGEHGRELARRAAAHLAVAGRRALARDDLPATVSLLSRAVALGEPDDAARLELLPDLGAACIDLGDLATAEDVLGDAIARARRTGDRRLESRAVLERAQMSRGGSVSAETLLREAKSAAGVFTEVGDDQGLSKAWRLVGESHLLRCRGAEAERALLQAAMHARLAGDVREETESLRWLARALLLGPAPVEEGIDRCEAVLEACAERRIAHAGTALILGGFEGMRGNYPEARLRIAAAREIFSDLGLLFRLAQSAFVAGRVELLAGEPNAAERELRDGYRLLDQLGERSYYLPIFAALTAHAACGQDRWPEAVRLSRVSEAAANPGDLDPQILWRSARGQALAGLGRLEEAEQVAREAVALAEPTDFLWDRADAESALATVLRVRGKNAAAADAEARALELYERKGIAVRGGVSPAALAAAVG